MESTQYNTQYSTPDLRAESLRALVGRADVSDEVKRKALNSRWDELDSETAQRRFVERGGIADPVAREAERQAAYAEYLEHKKEYEKLKADGRASSKEARQLIDRLWDSADRLRRTELTLEE